MSPQRKEGKVIKIYEILPEGVDQIDKTETEGFENVKFKDSKYNIEILETINELDKQIEFILSNPDMKKVQRANANKIMFDTLDGKAGLRAANHLKTIFPSLDKK